MQLILTIGLSTMSMGAVGVGLSNAVHYFSVVLFMVSCLLFITTAVPILKLTLVAIRNCIY